MLTVPEALARVLALLAPVGVETVGLSEAAGRVLAQPAVARRAQPPFDASAMDGYAVRAAEATPGARLRVVGEAPAGRAWTGDLGPGEALRIFTGAPLPAGADAVLIQENARAEGDAVFCLEAVAPGAWVRPAGFDFGPGASLPAPRRLSPADIAALAAMNLPEVVVRRRPRVALVPTGDELVEVGAAPAADQIVASSGHGLAALLAGFGAAPDLRPIAPDRVPALGAALRAAAGNADLIVTLGGASVGDHDLVRGVVGDAALSFYKVAMRPGKPLMAGRFAGVPIVGLPGNPVSAMVCCHIFLRSAIDALLGLPAGPAGRREAILAAPAPAEGPREHYARAAVESDGRVRLFENQDSSAQMLLAGADVLAVRPANAPAAAEGDAIEVVPLRSA
nr:molybdopterin molybdotransferase MoeA [Rubrimonas cliftonensis]